MKARLFWSMLALLLCLAAPVMPTAMAADQAANSMQQDLKSMQSFNQLHENETGILKVKRQTQHRILFFMGIALLIGLLLTAGFGLAMVLGGKRVFVWHMLFAGASITLAIAHAVTSIIWFYPF